tara:strand:- start:37 stop:567 length:531 start_codon:yes stop_codon:yes gene_type:complete
MNKRITIKSVKTFAGHDGHGWQCSVYLDGKKIPGQCINDGWGGGYYFNEPVDHDALNEACMQDDPSIEFCKIVQPFEFLVEDLVNKALQEKDMMRLTTKEVWFSLEGEDSRTVRTYKRREKVSSDRCMQDECRIIDGIENVALREGKAIVSIQGIRKAHDRLAQVQMQPEAERTIA